MKIIIFLLCLVISGCAVTSMSNLKEPEKNVEFVLEEDFVHFDDNLFGYKFAVGLIKGRYIAVAEDDEGYYFVPALRDTGLAFIMGGNMDEYENSGVLPAFLYKTSNTMGIWYPKPHSKKEYVFFQLIGLSTDENKMDVTYQTSNKDFINAAFMKIHEGDIVLPYVVEEHPDYSKVISIEFSNVKSATTQI